MKKLLAIFTSVLLLCAMLPLSAVGVSAEEEYTEGEYTYIIYEGDAHITSYNGSGGAVTIPDMLGGYSVTAIRFEAFDYDTNITSVFIPNSIIYITYPVFPGCSNLTSIIVAEDNPRYCSIEGVLFSKDKTELLQYPGGKSGAYAIPDSVTTIGFASFALCANLTSVTIPGSVTTIESAAFNVCTSLTSIQVAEDNICFSDMDGVLFNKDMTTLIAYPGGKKGEYNIPDGVTTIESAAFWRCYSLTSVTIPGSVTTIESDAFHDCTSLTEVYYTGSRTDRAAMRIDARRNEKLLNATWHYNCINPKDLYSADVQHSVMETENGNGLAFRFELAADGVSVKNRIEADLTNATVNYLGKDCKLLGMGAVMANDAAIGATAFTLDDVNNSTVLNIPAVYLCDLELDSCAFAVRIINIPNDQLERTIYARPYYVVEVDGEKIVVYGDVDSASCAEYM